jgi:hypothetical protein
MMLPKAFPPVSPQLVSHERWRDDPYIDFIVGQYEKNGYGSPLPVQAAQNVVFAEINHGRWLVLCPAECGQAVIASMDNPYFICANCGSFENNSHWYHVIFPIERDVINDLLCKRHLQNRNWKPTETVEMIMEENRNHGLH